MHCCAETLRCTTDPPCNFAYGGISTLPARREKSAQPRYRGCRLHHGLSQQWWDERGGFRGLHVDQLLDGVWMSGAASILRRGSSMRSFILPFVFFVSGVSACSFLLDTEGLQKGGTAMTTDGGGSSGASGAGGGKWEMRAHEPIAAARCARPTSTAKDRTSTAARSSTVTRASAAPPRKTKG